MIHSTMSFHAIPVASYIAAPILRTFAHGTAYRAQEPANSAMITVNLESIATVNNGGASDHHAEIYIGNDNTVGTAGGMMMGRYRNRLAGTSPGSISMTHRTAHSYLVALPKGWYMAIRQLAGTVTIVSVYDQAMA